MDFYASTTYGNTFSVVCVSEIAQGLTSTTRVGDSLKIQHIYFKFMCVANNASSGSSVRVLVFRDLDNSGTYPTATQFLESGNVSLSQVCPAKFNTRERFSILFDETVNVLVSSQSSACGGFSRDHAGHILYLGATAAQASNGKGSVFVAIYGTDNTNQATVTWWSRILYTDD